jgi:hypothetical protein
MYTKLIRQRALSAIEWRILVELLPQPQQAEISESMYNEDDEVSSR